MSAIFCVMRGWRESFLHLRRIAWGLPPLCFLAQRTT